MAEQGQGGKVQNKKLLKATMDRKMWRAVVTHVMKEHRKTASNLANVFFAMNSKDKEGK